MSLVLSAACRAERQAREKWGDAAQAFMVCEEAGELATAMAQFTRGRLKPEELLDEAADGVIVSCAATVLAGFDAGDLSAAVHRKLARLERRLRGEEGHFGVEPPGISRAELLHEVACGGIFLRGPDNVPACVKCGARKVKVEGVPSCEHVWACEVGKPDVCRRCLAERPAAVV